MIECAWELVTQASNLGIIRSDISMAPGSECARVPNPFTPSIVLAPSQVMKAICPVHVCSRPMRRAESPLPLPPAASRTRQA